MNLSALKIGSNTFSIIIRQQIFTFLMSMLAKNIQINNILDIYIDFINHILTHLKNLIHIVILNPKIKTTVF